MREELLLEVITIDLGLVLVEVLSIALATSAAPALFVVVLLITFCTLVFRLVRPLALAAAGHVVGIDLIFGLVLDI